MLIVLTELRGELWSHSAARLSAAEAALRDAAATSAPGSARRRVVEGSARSLSGSPRILDRIAIEGAELTDARESGRGVVVVMVHEVQFVAGIAAVARLTGTGTVVTGPAWYAPPTDAGTLMNWQVAQYLVDLGMRFLRAGNGATAEIRNTLGSGGLVVQMVDVNGRATVHVGGRVLNVAAGPARNALATDALMVITRIHRERWRLPKVAFGPTIETRGTDEDAIIALLTAEIARVDGRTVRSGGSERPSAELVPESPSA